MKEFCGHNQLFRLSKLLCLALLLFAFSTANAAPTVTHHGTDLSVSLSFISTQSTAIDSINTIARPTRAELANLGKELLQPPARSASLPNAPGNSIRLLPDGPTAALILLAGFLCVSLHRDRRVWLMALMGLLWICQAGIQILPRLGQHISHNSHTKHQTHARLTHPAYLGRFHRSRSDIEGTQYIGLLHHLGGIPDAKSIINLRISQPAVIFNSNLTLQLRCLASKVEQFVYFSPAFIFGTIPRGPPILA